MKFGRRMVIFALVAILVVAMSMTVSAASTDPYNNYNNYKINSVVITQYYPYTVAYQRKLDDSSHFVYHTGNAESVYVQSRGSSDSDGSSYANMTYKGGVIVEAVTIYSGYQYRVQNLVNENGYDYCALSFFPVDFSGTLAGWWHPGTYISGLPVA